MWVKEERSVGNVDITWAERREWPLELAKKKIIVMQRDGIGSLVNMELKGK